MDTSAQQHRVAIGYFAGRMLASSWVPSPKSWSYEIRKIRTSEAIIKQLQSNIVNFWMRLFIVTLSAIMKVLTLLLTF